MTDIDFKNIKKIYFIGIGGIGMSAVARMFSLEHKEVFGSDLSASEVTDELQKLGAEIRIGAPHDTIEKGAQLLPDGIDLVIYTVAIPENHPELVEARAKNIPTISYPESLSIISKDKFTIAVAGTHGKTTTTAMIAKILIDAGLDPTVIVGSLLRDQKSNFIAGKSKYFVVEACEYKRSFLNLKPDIAVVTNIDDDHLDYYKNLAGIQQGFTEFLGLVKKGGLVVTDVADEKIAPVVLHIQNSVAEKALQIFDYPSVEVLDTDIHLKIPGHHNIQNAKAALAVALELGVPLEKALESLAGFSGTWRRFEDKGQTATGALVYDDYAHHPSEIAATLQAAREKFPQGVHRLVVAFQPHLYSRTKEHVDEFAAAFANADEVLLLPIYAAREPADAAISSEIVAEKMIVENGRRGIAKSAQKVSVLENLPAAAEYLKKNLTKNDVLFTMGAGDITTLSEMVLG